MPEHPEAPLPTLPLVLVHWSLLVFLLKELNGGFIKQRSLLTWDTKNKILGPLQPKLLSSSMTQKVPSIFASGTMCSVSTARSVIK